MPESNRPFLAFPHAGFLAHTVRLLEISRVLRDMGYQVLFFSSGKYGRLIREAHFPLEEVFCLDPDALMERLRLGDVEFYTQDTYERSVREEMEIFQRYRPACVLGDHRWSLRSSTELSRIPYVSVLNASWTRFWALPIRPYEHHPLTRALGGGRLARRLVSPLVPVAARLFKKAGAREQNRWRAANGLSQFEVHLESFEGDVNLLADVPEYSPCRQLPDNFHYVGPLTWEPDVPAPDWLRGYRKTRPVVYVSFGSTGDPRYFPVVLDLLAEREVDVIVTTGGLAEIESAPGNCRVADLLPGSAVMAISDLLVCHGGNGTIYQALAAGVPVVGIPTCITQEIEMDQVEHCGCGIQVSETRFRRAELARAIDRVLYEPDFRSRARSLQSAVRDARGRDAAARQVAAFVDAAPSAAR